ncbi:MAG TPA: acetate--CoA ligase [Candidatus Limnocylindria bacterium]
MSTTQPPADTEPADAATIENLLREDRTFPPPPAFTAQANAGDPDIYQRAASDEGFEQFWAEESRRLDWMEPWTQLLDWSDAPFAKWFVGGKLNISVNCLDRHVANGLGDKVAYHWEGEPGDQRTITYAQLLAETCQMANALRELGVRKGDRVAIYMPMIPELPVAMLACARIGAPHSVVFGGFSADALAGRLEDAQCTTVITADGGYRKGAMVPLKENADDAMGRSPSVEHCIVVRRTGQDVAWTEGRDYWYHDLVTRQPTTAEPEVMDSEDLLYLLYTSGTTAKPKGIMHTTAGYLVGTATTHQYIFDIKPDDTYWCMADIGWVTGHSYIVYGPLANATTGVIYEGAIDFPNRDRWAQIAARLGVTILYTAPTAIRALMKYGADAFAGDDLSSLRLLGSVGEPINPEAWAWYWQHIGGGRCPVVDTWWQTETGMIMITPLPGITTLKPGSATQPFPGIKADVVNEQGESVPFGGGGYLVLDRPWPAMLRGIYGDPDRYRQTYWSRFPGRYFAGDGCKRDTEGYYWLLGRVDDVMNVSGHRISTTEVESALVSHPSVAEAAVVGRSDPITGQAIFSYVILRAGHEPSEELANELREHVATVIGKLARPKQVMFTPDLPKTRSGKIMRRLLRDIAEQRDLGDVTTLADAGIVSTIRDQSGAGEED